MLSSPQSELQRHGRIDRLWCLRIDSRQPVDAAIVDVLCDGPWGMAEQVLKRVGYCGG